MSDSHAENTPPAGMDRRRFAAQFFKLGCVASAGLAVGQVPAVAQEAAPPVPPPVPVEVPRPRTPGRLLLETVTRLYPNGLEPEHLEPILAEIERQLARSEVLASFPLTNSDEPAPLFAAYRAPDPKG